jgi:hypothetical protein
MAGDLKVFNLENRIITHGTTQMDGWADGDVATVEWDDKAFSYKKGADGEAIIGKIYGRSGTMKLRLLQTSAANTKLSATLNLALKSKNGAGIAPLQMADVFGATLFHAQKAWIEGEPPVPTSADGAVIEWSIKFHNGEITIAGS